MPTAYMQTRYKQRTGRKTPLPAKQRLAKYPLTNTTALCSYGDSHRVFPVDTARVTIRSSGPRKIQWVFLGKKGSVRMEMPEWVARDVVEHIGQTAKHTREDLIKHNEEYFRAHPKERPAKKAKR